MKRLFGIIILFAFIMSVNAQTMHTLVFINKSEKGRTLDRTAEFNQMTAFATEVCNAIGFRHDLRTHTDSEFTAKMALQEINSLNIQEGDIVFFYYSGHGVNWDDDQWPHMAFLDEQYHETTLYNKLKEKCSKAKLTICIAACCNMDSEGRKKEEQKELDRALSSNLTKQLFTGFNGKKFIKISSSIRGQYSISWSTTNPADAPRMTLGAVYGISFRDIMRKVLSGNINCELSWNSVLDAINKKTLVNTDNKQLPQFKIEEIATTSVPSVPSQQPQQSQSHTQQQSGNNGGNNMHNARTSARVTKTWVEQNASIDNLRAVGIHCDFTANHMNENGGMVVALFYSKDGKILKDINGRYSVDGLVAAAEDFGTHHEFSRIKDEVVYIPYNEIHVQDSSDIVYAEINIYDYKTKKLIATGTPVSVRIR